MQWAIYLKGKIQLIDDKRSAASSAFVAFRSCTTLHFLEHNGSIPFILPDIQFTNMETHFDDVSD